MTPRKLFLFAGACLCCLSVILGAFGAHGLKEFLERGNFSNTYQIASTYMFFHSLGILIIGSILFHLKNKFIEYSGVMLLIGIFLFSGSLYMLCIIGHSMIAAITPFGGFFLVTGWISLAVGIVKSSDQ
jgi:uncharacterized membrane protein YgdD (TMEM256/DUF423 family)